MMCECIFQEMARHRILSWKEIDDIVNADDFFDSDNEDDDNGLIHIMEIPPEQVDEESDDEDINDNIIDDEEP